MSSPSKRRRNCTNYKKSWKSGNRGGGKSRMRNRWQEAANVRYKKGK